MRSRPSRQAGFTYLAVLFALALMGATAALTAVVYSVLERREREAQLLFVGAEIQSAIQGYFEANPKLPDRYPKELSWLLRDPNQLTTRRYLRQLYFDPLTGSNEWGLLRSPGGGIMGVYSLSARAPIKRAGFTGGAVFGKAASYADWKFVFPWGASAAPGIGVIGTAAPAAGSPGAGGAGSASSAPATAAAAQSVDAEDSLRDTCDILNGADQGYCRSMELRMGAAAGSLCRGIAAQRMQVCKTSPKGPYPPLRP